MDSGIALGAYLSALQKTVKYLTVFCSAAPWDVPESTIPRGAGDFEQADTVMMNKNM